MLIYKRGIPATHPLSPRWAMLRLLAHSSPSRSLSPQPLAQLLRSMSFLTPPGWGADKKEKNNVPCISVVLPRGRATFVIDSDFWLVSFCHISFLNPLSCLQLHLPEPVLLLLAPTFSRSKPLGGTPTTKKWQSTPLWQSHPFCCLGGTAIFLLSGCRPNPR